MRFSFASEGQMSASIELTGENDEHIYLITVVCVTNEAFTFGGHFLSPGSMC